MKKIIAAGLAVLALSGCSQAPGDVLLKTYSGPAHVIHTEKYKKSCKVEIVMLKNGMTANIMRSGRESCPEAEGSIIVFIGGRKL